MTLILNASSWICYNFALKAFSAFCLVKTLFVFVLNKQFYFLRGVLLFIIFIFIAIFGSSFVKHWILCALGSRIHPQCERKFLKN